MGEPQCPPDCGKCCWCVPFPAYLWEATKDRAVVPVLEEWAFGPGNILPITEDMHCPFLNRETRRCLIHPMKPEVCKNYGHGAETCPYLRADGTPRTPIGVERWKANHSALENHSDVTLRQSKMFGDVWVKITLRVDYDREQHH